MTYPKLLIVDDNESIYKSLQLNFRQEGFDCVWAPDTAAALAAAADADIAAVLMDLSLGRENGIEAMQAIFKRRSGLPVIIITGYGTFEAAVQAIKLGAFDFLSKPLEFTKLMAVVSNAVHFSMAEPEPSSDSVDPFLITQSPNMLELCRKARRIATTDIPVLITGESGTGKELLAGLIHRHSARRDRAFLRVNSSAFADSLIDSELFGHEKGAFTGAVDSRPGLFEQADGGTLHLDEIGDMSLTTQAKILRVLENASLRRVGGSRDISVNVRIMASTNKNLLELIERGYFREDLFYRLNSIFLYMPPLRERPGDILLLAKHFLNEFAGSAPPKRLTPEAETLFASYPWPGNIRELRNAVKVSVVITDSNDVRPEDLPEQLSARSFAAGSMENAEKDLIQKTLLDSHGNKKQASQRLGISRRTLYNKMDKYGL